MPDLDRRRRIHAASAAGLTLRQIAKQEGISAPAVHKHLTHPLPAEDHPTTLDDKPTAGPNTAETTQPTQSALDLHRRTCRPCRTGQTTPETCPDFTGR